MAGSTASGEHIRKAIVSRVLAGIAVLAIVLLLLNWGLSATQWTILTTNNNLGDAVANGQLGSESYTYSIPQGVEQDIYVGVYFQPGYRLFGPDGSLFYGLAKPVSNSTTTSEYYVSFTISHPNGSAVTVWFTSPQGNLTQDCGIQTIPPFAEVACTLVPALLGTELGAYSNFFQAPTAGNYTIHVLSTQCPTGYNTCSSTNATVGVTRALSSVTYTRPYYNVGQATVMVAEVSIAVSIAILAITCYQVVIQQRKTRPPSVGRPSSPVVD
jgi:hypothetical protein